VAFVEIVGHEQSLSGRSGGDARNDSDLREAAGDIAGSLLIQCANKLSPMDMLKAKHTIQ
jgi:hypothetical protein